jgi:hypothetical protein
MAAKRPAESRATATPDASADRSGAAPAPRLSPSASKGVYIGLQSRGVFALPADMRKRHHLDEPGAQLLVIERDDGVLELHPQLAVPAGQKWFWSEGWQAMEAEASDDVAAGRVSRSDSADELFDDLDALRESR